MIDLTQKEMRHCISVYHRMKEWMIQWVGANKVSLPANTRRWPNIKPASGKRVVFAGYRCVQV